MYQSKEVFVDGGKYTFHHLSVRQLNKVFIKVAKILSAAIPNKVAGNTEDILNTDLNIELIMKALRDHCDENTMDEIMMIMFSSCIKEGGGRVHENMDLCFGKNIMTMYKLLLEAFSFYFSDFFVEGSELSTIMKAVQIQK